MNVTENESSGQNRVVTISKETLATLPAEEFSGEIILVDTPEKVERAIKTLKNSPLIGFDTETRPSFKKGQQYDVSLIQLSNSEQCFLFRINIIGFPKELKNILEDPGQPKVGLSIHDDFHNIRKTEYIEPAGFTDLQSFVKDFRIADISLSKIYAILFDKRISKGQRLTNWEAGELTEPQMKYAALDAAACIKIYNYLKEGKFDPLTSKYLTIIPEVPEVEEAE